MQHDELARERAIDPTCSCVVQAPAGSGKTELLTQRYLRLLSRVHEPETIVALTFTRKAAREMRERITQALTQAAQLTHTPTVPKKTLHYAQLALRHSKQRGWQLLEIPSRLRITTIDALCQRIANAMPLHDQQTPYAQLTDSPDTLYRQASEACLMHLMSSESHHPQLCQLLTHLDNRQDRLLNLFIDQLRCRDQWLRKLFHAKTQNKHDYEVALERIEHHHLNHFMQTVPIHLRDTLMRLTQDVTRLNPKASIEQQSLLHWQHWHELNRSQAQALASVLLTTQNTLRKAFDHHIGLVKQHCSSAQEYKNLKVASQHLLLELDEHTDFLHALVQVKRLPPPTYPDASWHILQALLAILPLLAAHLQLIFNQTNQMDFTEVAHLAQHALGGPDAPTDLALHLDHSIHHLLVDEFQDTSIQQFELISHLVEGFVPGDGKTLFVVGDPMQSIYRFRGAEVGLFLRAKHHGMGPVKLTSLQLTRNFRSTHALITWTNQQFCRIFPKHDDLELGAVAFHPAVPVRAAADINTIQCQAYPTLEDQTHDLIRIIQHEISHHHDQKIAILVRSRNQLGPIVQQLREHNIPYQGIDIDWMLALPHVRDVWTLTKALLSPANRLAWLALLRSPWCGLKLRDILTIATFDKHQSILHALNHLDAFQHELNDETQMRVRCIHAILVDALNQRRQQSISHWLIATLNRLHINAVLTTRERDELEQFWSLLDKFEQLDQLTDLKRIEHELKTLYSKQVTPSTLQIMTIHKSKGLEFDCVILPSLNGKRPRQQHALLRWLTLPRAAEEPLVLVSPLHASKHETCPLYDYLGRVNLEKEHYEQQRLLYVAITRAKSRLYLLDQSPKGSTNTFRDLLCHVDFSAMPATPSMATVQHTPYLAALPNHFYTHPATISACDLARIKPTTHDPFMRIVGTVTHELLEWICTHHPQTALHVPWYLAQHAFEQAGLTAIAVNSAMEQVHQMIEPLFRLPRGQWLIQAHDNEHNEYELLVLQNAAVQSQIIDRTFHHKGQCWIIDFKTGHDDEKAEQRHREQVNTYAHHLSHTSALPIHCGLYYLNNQRWVEWVWEQDTCVLASNLV